MGSNTSREPPVGVRNNNPGNIKASTAFDWQGQTGEDDKGFCTFSEPRYGVRAISRVLDNYSKIHNLDTVDRMIRRWSATDQDAYVQNVCTMLSVEPNQAIDVGDPRVKLKMIRAIIKQECGYEPYMDVELARWMV